MNNDALERRFLLRNPDGLTDAELLELLLRFSSPDAKALAHRLLDRFGCTAAILEATAEELAVAAGAEADDILLLRLVPELHRRYFLSRKQTETRLRSSMDIGNYLLPFFHGARDELVYLLCLDAAGKVLRCVQIGHGSVNSAAVPIRRLVEEALHTNASAVVLAHNHPAGIATPSKEDVELTLRLREALEVIDIQLCDHILVADDDFVSLRDSGYLRRRF
ncbi:MAG: DNA repair protein RadC [Oscillospiraceae bacterium]|nr:DNA repair protein RadC [Oscillospiraceae bacterium]